MMILTSPTSAISSTNVTHFSGLIAPAAWGAPFQLPGPTSPRAPDSNGRHRNDWPRLSQSRNPSHIGGSHDGPRDPDAHSELHRQLYNGRLPSRLETNDSISGRNCARNRPRLVQPEDNHYQRLLDRDRPAHRHA